MGRGVPDHPLSRMMTLAGNGARFTVIASQRVGAKAPPDDRLREAIQRVAKTGLLRRWRSSQ
jgi:hypothetical protein